MYVLACASSPLHGLALLQLCSIVPSGKFQCHQNVPYDFARSGGPPCVRIADLQPIGPVRRNGNLLIERSAAGRRGQVDQVNMPHGERRSSRASSSTGSSSSISPAISGFWELTLRRRRMSSCSSMMSGPLAAWISTDPSYGS